jgi:hypothetical protein
LCGLQKLSRDERLSRANEILNSTELKQAICHQILGCTFKDIERAMAVTIDERQITEAQAERMELEEMAPEKFDPQLEFKINKEASNIKKDYRYTTYSMEEVQKLLAASNAPYVPQEPTIRTEYKTMPRELAEQLVREHFEYKEMERKKKEDLKGFNEKVLNVSSFKRK